MREDRGELYRVTTSFAITGPNGVPEVFAEGEEVFGDDPILRTHGHHFELAANRVTRRVRRVEQATAAPGELRTPMTPVLTEKETSDGRPV